MTLKEKKCFIGLISPPRDTNKLHAHWINALMLGTCLSILREVCEWVRDGKITPIRSCTVFPASDAMNAFRTMQAGKHIGKLLIQMHGDSAGLPKPRFMKNYDFAANSSYLLVGGLGGIGRAVSSWMVAKGARHLIYLSRAAGISQDDQEFISELRYQGCDVVCVAGDVANKEDVERARNSAPRRVAGVIQLAVNLQVRFSRFL